MLCQDHDDLNGSFAFKEAFADVFRAKHFSQKLPGTRQKYLISYKYCEKGNCIYVVWGQGDDIQFMLLTDLEGAVVTGPTFQDIYGRYFRSFLDTTGHGIYGSTGYDQLKEDWAFLYALFIVPWVTLQYEAAEFFVHFYFTINDRVYSIDFSVLHNLLWRFEYAGLQQDLFFVSVSSPSLATYINNLSAISFPVLSNTELLFGLHDFDHPEVLKNCKDEHQLEKQLHLAKIFVQLCNLILQGGGKVTYLHSLDDLRQAIEGQRGKLIHLFSHFHGGRLSTRGPNGIGMGRMKAMLKELKAAGTLHDNISLDFITCTSIQHVRSLYSAGINYLYASHQDFRTDLALYSLYEMYAGTIVCTCKRPFPYFNGNAYLHEARSGVQRSFFYHMAAYGDIPLI